MIKQIRPSGQPQLRISPTALTMILSLESLKPTSMPVKEFYTRERSNK